MISYDIVATGSTGNAVVINKNILIDCGVSLKALSDVKNKIKLVLLTHIHSDHFNKVTIRNLAHERPSLRFACCDWLVDDLISCGVSHENIDILEIGCIYDYGIFKVSPIKLYHDVQNAGWRIFCGNEKIIYATDTCTLNGISAKNYNLYLIEANYETEEIQKKIKEKEEAAQFVYEYRVLKTHLSKEAADEWLLQNIGDDSKYVYIHQHKEKD